MKWVVHNLALAIEFHDYFFLIILGEVKNSSFSLEYKTVKKRTNIDHYL